MMRTTNKILTGLILASGLSAVWAAPAPPTAASPLEESVRKGLVTIPFLTVFDDLSFRVDNGVVTLLGQASQPIVMDYAEGAVKHLPGVTAVKDQIELLPLSRFDDQIRFQTLRALNRTPSLYRYFMGTYPSIRIVVKNGHVTLDGVVQNSMDRQLAFMAANQVPGVFSVVNDLRTQP
jgi:hyperosmotically inducible periplasmic protein